MPDSDLTAHSIEDLHRGLRDGTVRSEELAEWSIAGWERAGEGLHAYKLWAPDALRAQARAADAAFAAGLDFGALQGMPVSIKDIYGARGYPTFAGTPQAMSHKWEAEGPVVAALRASLAPVTGKTHTVEFAFGGVGTNPHWGTPRNPWDAGRHRAPGGSSAGAGVSLLTGTAVIAVGSDTAGSVRVPACVTGTVGIKTSYGRWSSDGIVPLSPSLDTAGILARTAADAAIGFALIDPLTHNDPLAFLDTMRHGEAGDFTVGLCDWFFEDCAPDIARAIEEVTGELGRAGLTVVSVDLPEAPRADELFRKGGLAAPEFAAFINGEMAAYKETLDANVASRFARMEAITAVEYLHRRRELETLSRAAATRFADVDLIVGPTLIVPPPDIAPLSDPETYQSVNLSMLRNTAPVNLLGLCAVTMPVALDGEGLPVGLQIIAPHGEDDRAIAAACAFEKVLGTARDRLGVPPLCRA